MEKVVAVIRDAFVRADPLGAATYCADADRYLARLRKLDAGVRACIAKVFVNQWLLVISYDVLGYYVRCYGIKVVGVVIFVLMIAVQLSVGDVAKLVDMIECIGVCTIFVESFVNLKVEQVIAYQTGVCIGCALWVDTFGPAGSSGAIYIGSIEANTSALADGFTFGAVECCQGIPQDTAGAGAGHVDA